MYWRLPVGVINPNALLTVTVVEANYWWCSVALIHATDDKRLSLRHPLTAIAVLIESVAVGDRATIYIEVRTFSLQAARIIEANCKLHLLASYVSYNCRQPCWQCIQGGAKNGAILSHCKYSENSRSELRRNWWTSAILYAEHSHWVFV